MTDTFPFVPTNEMNHGSKVRMLAPTELLLTGILRLTSARPTERWSHDTGLETGEERGAAALAVKVGARAEPARDLSYRLYNLCERKKRVVEGLWHNGLVQSWLEIMRLSRTENTPVVEQGYLFEE